MMINRLQTSARPASILLSIVLIGMLSASFVAGQTDEEHTRFRQQSPEFNRVELELSNTWKALTNILPENDRLALIEVQRAWIRTGRKQYAMRIMHDKNTTEVQGYTEATRERTAMLRTYLQQMLHPDSPISVTGVIESRIDSNGPYWMLQCPDLALPYMLGHESELVGNPTLREQLKAHENHPVSVEVRGFLISLDAFALAKGLGLTSSAGSITTKDIPRSSTPADQHHPMIELPATTQPDIPTQRPSPQPPRMPEIQDQSGGLL